MQWVVLLHKCVANGSLDLSVFDGAELFCSAVKECEVLDYKRQLPDSDAEYAKVVRDLVAFHNSYGGFLIFGVEEVEKDRRFEIVGVPSGVFHVAKLKDLARSYLGADLRISVESREVRGKNIEIAWVAKRRLGESPLKFAKNGPDEKPSKPSFKKGEVVYRRLDNNAIAKEPEDYDFLYSARHPPSIDLAAVDFSQDEPLEHNLPDRTFVCSRFIGRREDLGDLWSWLADDFSRVRLIAGEGGLGKTSLAYNFAEEMASRRVKPFEKIVWLTAKRRQFIPSEDGHRDNVRTDFEDAISLFRVIASEHGCIDSDFDDLDVREIQRLALDSCGTMPSFIIVDDVDSLTPNDQQRVLEFGMRTPQRTKMLLTTRVNFSYSPDNVLKLNGLASDEFLEFISVLRGKYGLPQLKEGKAEYLREVVGGSPLFTDSLLRLERRGLSLDQAINQWKGEKGLEVRKAALKREIEQLSREAKRVLYTISHVRSASLVELAQILSYTEQTLGDALHELAGLFLVSAPAIGKEARYTVDPNTGLLVLELGSSLGIDHAAIVSAIKRARSDAVGISLQKRSNIVGQAIAQAIALLKQGDSKGALDTVQAASKQLSRPNADLSLAVGRFSLKLNPPALTQAVKAFSESFNLGQRKQLLFDLWFDAEYARGAYDDALEVTSHAIENSVGDISKWYERRAQVRVALARRSKSKFSLDSAIREVDAARADLKTARSNCNNDFQRRQIDQLLLQAEGLRSQLARA
ncbi:MAG: RNA-binding domain-containing protein [Pseudomonadota bacterium]